MTIMEALQWANNKLRKVGIDSPMLDAEILLAHTLDTSKSWLFSHFNDKLRAHHKETFHQLVERRSKREPIAYILERKAFYSRTFFVNSHVLIPRPETELLIDCALNILESRNEDTSLLVDLGTGSGAIAVTLALETPIPVLGVDIDQEALSIAKKNAHHLGAQQITFHQGNLLEPVIKIFEKLRQEMNGQFSSTYPYKSLIITANLPYLSENQMEKLQPEVQYEPNIALEAGIDGLDLYESLFVQISIHRQLFPRELIVFIEIDPGQTLIAKKLIQKKFSNAMIHVHKDLQGHDRIIEMYL